MQVSSTTAAITWAVRDAITLPVPSHQRAPRRTNLLVHHALLAAPIAKANNVTTEHVQTALDEFA